MSPNRRKLTDKFLEGIKPTSAGRVTYSDELRRGLSLRVGTRKASWVYEKRIKGGGKRKNTIGTYCGWTASGHRTGVVLSLADARRIALEIELEANLGVDRVDIAREQRINAAKALAALKTVGDALNAYEKLKLDSLRTGADRKRDLRRVLAPMLNEPASALTRSALQAIIDDRITAGRLVYANRLRAYLRAFTRWAHRREYLPEDIGQDLEGSGAEQPRDRVLSLDEVRRIYAKSFEMGALWGPMIRLLLLTGQRSSEITKLTWSEVDLRARQIRLEGQRTKNSKPHITHLSEPALSELSSLLEGATSEFVFSTTGRTPSSGLAKGKKRLEKLLGDDVTQWRFHDFRRAMATALAQAGVPEGVVDRIQNHSATGSAPSAVARVYQQADLLPQRAEALDRWAAMVLGEERQVIEFPRTADDA